MRKFLLPTSLEVLSLSYDILMKQVGTKEKTGHNDGDVVKYLNSIGLGAGNAYCLAGQYYCFEEASKELNRPNPLYKTGLTKRLIRFAEDHAVPVEFKPAKHDLICWRHHDPDIRGHVERIIDIITPRLVRTVGFNTSNGKIGSQREGDGVFIRVRKIGDLGKMYLNCLIGFEVND